MAVKELRDYLENGNIKNSVNFPNCDMGVCIQAGRVAIFHKNIANMIAQFTSVLGNAKYNISGMIDQNRNDIAYALIDVDGKVDDAAISSLEAIADVINVRPIFA